MDSTNLLPQIEPGQASKEVTANGNFAAASPAMAFAQDAPNTLGLVFAYLGARRDASTLIAAGTHACGASTTVYMAVAWADWTVSFSTSSTDWDDHENYGQAYKITAGVSSLTWLDCRGGQYGILGGVAPSDPIPIEIQVACSDLVTALTTGTSKGYVRAPCAVNLTEVRASLLQASSSGAVTVDINASGATILGTKLTVDQSEKTSQTAATPFAFNSGGDYLADDEEVTIDIDGAGSSALGLVVTLIGTRA